MQIANVKQRQILPRVGKIWVSTPQNRTYRPGSETAVFSKIESYGAVANREEIRRNTQAKTHQAKTYRAWGRIRITDLNN